MGVEVDGVSFSVHLFLLSPGHRGEFLFLSQDISRTDTGSA
jgi:hypothetical protein